MALFLLPADLIIELSLYLNHKQTLQLIKIFPQLVTRCWLNKIEKELGFSTDFINKYIYANGQKITLLSLDEKYLELKGRKSIDFGVEKYIIAEVFIHRASREQNPECAREYLKYIFDQLATVHLYSVAIEGLMSMITRGKNMFSYVALLKSIIQKWPSTESIDPHLVRGSYEGSCDHERNKLLLTCLMSVPLDLTGNITQIYYMLQGMANGGHVQELTKSSSNSYSYFHIVRDAIEKHKRLEILNYAKSVSNIDDMLYRLMIPNFFYYNNYEILKNFTLQDYQKKYMTNSSLECGYLELVDQLENPIDNQLVLRTIMQFNHLDALNYVQLKYGIKSTLLDHYNITNVIYHQTVDMFNFLCQYELFDLDLLKHIDILKLRQLNPQLYEHLSALDLI